MQFFISIVKVLLSTNFSHLRIEFNIILRTFAYMFHHLCLNGAPFHEIYKKSSLNTNGEFMSECETNYFIALLTVGIVVFKIGDFNVILHFRPF